MTFGLSRFVSTSPEEMTLSELLAWATHWKRECFTLSFWSYHYIGPYVVDIDELRTRPGDRYAHAVAEAKVYGYNPPPKPKEKEKYIPIRKITYGDATLTRRTTAWIRTVDWI